MGRSRCGLRCSLEAIDQVAHRTRLVAQSRGNHRASRRRHDGREDIITAPRLNQISVQVFLVTGQHTVGVAKWYSNWHHPPFGDHDEVDPITSQSFRSRQNLGQRVVRFTVGKQH